MRQKFKSVFMEKHQLMGMIFVKHAPTTRAEKLNMILVLLMLKLFATGLFYDADRNLEEEGDEEDKTLEESLKAFGWEDFWIMIYTMVIVIPVPLVLNLLFTRKEIAEEDTIEKVKKV